MKIRIILFVTIFLFTFCYSSIGQVNVPRLQREMTRDENSHMVMLLDVGSLLEGSESFVFSAALGTAIEVVDPDGAAAPMEMTLAASGGSHSTVGA